MKKKKSEANEQGVPARTTVFLEDILREGSPHAPLPSTTPAPAGRPVIGRLVDDRDPQESARLLVRWEINGKLEEKWLCRLRGLEVAKGDTVIVQYLENGAAPVVSGVIETDITGEKPRDVGAVAEQAAGATVQLSKGAVLTVTGANGTPLVEIAETASGPTLKVLSVDTVIDLPGRLALSADAIKLSAKKGTVEVSAEDDVIVVGKSIYLN